MKQSDLLNRFIERAHVAGAEIWAEVALTAVIEAVQEFLRSNKLKKVVISPDFSSAIPGDDATLFDSFEYAEPRSADIGLVRADCAVAETGTLVHFDHGDDEKAAWTMPPVCLCLLDKSRIVASAEDVADEMVCHLSPDSGRAAQVSFITGSSRTADIENQLTIGVHGPKRLVVFLVES